MSRPRLLDLFCGAGGAAMGYHRAGFDVTGVDIKPQPNYPFQFIMGDALEFLREHGKEYDAIHASPPCQAYCALKTMVNRREHPDLIAETRELLRQTEKPWIIENVFGAPMNGPIMLCGSHFGLCASNGYQLRRHRYFETFPFLMDGHECDHSDKTVGVYGAKARDIAQERRHYAKDKETRGEPEGVVLPQWVGLEAMGIDWMTMDELSEAIPPAYTEWIGKQMMKVVRP